VYKKFNQTSRTIRKDKRRNKELTKNPNVASTIIVCEHKKTDKLKMEDLILEKSTHQQLEINLLNQLISELGGMLQSSNTKQVSLQVMLKRETRNELKNGTENAFEDVDLKNLILKLNGHKDSSRKDVPNDPFDKQLQDLIKQLEEECKEVNAIGKYEDERKPTSEKYHNDTNRDYIGKSKTKKSRCINQDVHVIEKLDIIREMEMP
jgi:hypothetical protein